MSGTLGRGILIGGVASILMATWVAIGALEWIGRPFPGFLILENAVVASAGLTHWPATSSGTIFQHEVKSFDGIPLREPTQLQSYVESKPVGTIIAYSFSRGGIRIDKAISTRMFTTADGLLLFGATFASGLALLGVALALLYMAPRDPASVGCAVSFGVIGTFALTALDLYGPYHFFRLHALSECFLAAGTIHMALVFPHKRELANRFPWLIPSAYLVSASLGIATQIYLFNPSGYTFTHRLAVALAGLAFGALVVTQVGAYLRPKSLAARQRVAILAMGTFASITPGVLIIVTSTLTGGEAPENLMAWAGAFFPISVAYAVLRSDLLQVDAILRRTVNYVILTLTFGVMYAAMIGGTEWLAQRSWNIPRWTSIVAFSLFVTFVMLPLRDRVQSWIDRLFFRSVYDFRVTIEETSAKLARLIDLDKIRKRIRTTVTDALQPESVELFVYSDEAETDRLGHGGGTTRSGIVDLDSGGIAIPFQSYDRIVAKLVLGRRMSGRFYTGVDRGLLQILANQGAIAIENALALERLQDLNKTLEIRVRDRTAELALAVEELTETQEQLVQAERLAAVGELAAGVAHEVNNPLNFARNSLRTLKVLVEELAEYAGALSSLNLSEPQDLARQAKEILDRFGETDALELADDLKQLVEILGSGLDRTARLVSDLRDFASPQESRHVPFDLASALNSSIELTSTTLKGLGIHVDLRVHPSLPNAIGDASSFSQVILNVIKNAADALAGQDEATIQIELTYEEDEGKLRLRIADNGPGIRPEHAEKIFDPFFTTKDAGKGTGLGLALCQRVVQEHSGDIWISSEPEHGTEVYIELPAHVESS